MGMNQAVLVQNELAQALGLICITLVQSVSEQASGSFPLQRAAKRDTFVAGRAEPQGKGLGRFCPAAHFYQYTLE